MTPPTYLSFKIASDDFDFEEIEHRTAGLRCIDRIVLSDKAIEAKRAGALDRFSGAARIKKLLELGSYHNDIEDDNGRQLPARQSYVGIQENEDGSITHGVNEFSRIHMIKGEMRNTPNDEPAVQKFNPCSGKVVSAQRAVDGELVSLAPEQLHDLNQKQEQQAALRFVA